MPTEEQSPLNPDQRERADALIRDPAAPDAHRHDAGKVRPMVLLWALGVPIPLLIVIFVIRGCV